MQKDLHFAAVMTILCCRHVRFQTKQTEMSKTMKAEEILKILAEKRQEIRQRYKAEVRGLFGSVVRGEEKRESDVDILVDFDERADLFDYVGLGLFLEEKLNRKVDIVPQKALGEEIKANVLQEMVYL